MNRFLFVYGTLRQGLPNDYAQFLGNRAHHKGLASVRARMYEISGYPGIIPSRDHRDQGRGDLYELLSPESVLTYLDAYEGYAESARPETCDYLRREMNVHLLNGQTLKAWVYLYNREVDDRKRVHGGDYRSYPGNPGGGSAR